MTLFTIGIILGILTGAIVTFVGIFGILEVINPEVKRVVAKKFKKEKMSFHSPTKSDPLEGVEDDELGR